MNSYNHQTNFISHPFDYHQEIIIKIDKLTNLGVGIGRVNLAHSSFLNKSDNSCINFVENSSVEIDHNFQPVYENEAQQNLPFIEIISKNEQTLENDLNSEHLENFEQSESSEKFETFEQSKEFQTSEQSKESEQFQNSEQIKCEEKIEEFDLKNKQFERQWVVMVAFALPGEIIRARVFRNHKNYSEADLIEVLTSSPFRKTPECKYFGVCGGCQYQNISYEQQLFWKAEHVRDSFNKIGKFEYPEILPTIPSPKQTSYRSKITPHFKKVKVEKFPIGFLKQSSRQVILDVEHCLIAVDLINRHLPVIREKTWAKSHKRGGTLLIRKTQEGIVTDSNAIVSEKIGKKAFWFYAGGFFQNNPYILETLIDYVVKEAVGTETLLDIYCGIGIFGICASQYFKNVIGYEIDTDAIELAKHNAQVNMAKNCKFEVKDAKEAMSDFAEDPSKTSIIIDPPRKGCDEKLLEVLCVFKPAKIVYVSCSPDTQARDLNYLTKSGVFKIDRVQPFDLFPQTRHIENVVTISRKFLNN